MEMYLNSCAAILILSILMLGCGSEPLLTPLNDSEHAHHHLHATDVAHEHDHTDPNAGAHAHSHKHTSSETRSDSSPENDSNKGSKNLLNATNDEPKP